MIIIMDMASGTIDTLQCPTQDTAPAPTPAHGGFPCQQHALALGLQEVATSVLHATRASRATPPGIAWSQASWHPELTRD